MYFASLCSLAGRYDNPIATRFLAPIDWLKIPVQYVAYKKLVRKNLIQLFNFAYFESTLQNSACTVYAEL